MAIETKGLNISEELKRKIGTILKKRRITKIKEYHKQDLYNNMDLHDIADNTSKEKEINDYLYENKYYDNPDDIEI